MENKGVNWRVARIDDKYVMLTFVEDNRVAYQMALTTDAANNMGEALLSPVRKQELETTAIRNA